MGWCWAADFSFGGCVVPLTAEDAAILRAGWDDRTLADMLFMPVGMLRQRRQELSGKAPMPSKVDVSWTPEQNEWLAQARANRMTFEDIAQNMGRTKNSVVSRSRRLRGIK
jgi:hypothetical protein